MAILTMRGAPKYVRDRFARTGASAAICRLVERGATWEEADARLVEAYQRWFDRGAVGMSPVRRLSNRVWRSRVLARIDAGEPFHTLPNGMVAVGNLSYVRPRRMA